MTVSLQCLLLAAGNASRMGQIKQLLQWQGKPLIVHALEQLCSANMDVLLVLGANSDLIIKQIQPKNFVINANWQSGLGNSIAFGVRQLDQHCEAVFIALADQIALTTEHYQQLLNLWQTNPQKIVCAQYEGLPGVPAIFPRRYFSALTTLQGEKGAKSILLENCSNLALLEMPQANIDIDTPKDWQAWFNST